MANVTVKAMLMRTWPKWAAEIVICVYSFSQPLSPFNYVLRSLWWCNGCLFSSEQMMAVVWGLQIPERGVQCPEVWKLLTLWGGGWNPNLAVQLWLKLLLDLNVRAMRGIWTTFPMLVLRLVVQSSVFRTQACSRYWLKVHSTYSDQFIFWITDSTAPRWEEFCTDFMCLSGVPPQPRYMNPFIPEGFIYTTQHVPDMFCPDHLWFIQQPKLFFHYDPSKFIQNFVLFIRDEPAHHYLQLFHILNYL